MMDMVTGRFYWAVPDIDSDDTTIHMEVEDPASGNDLCRDFLSSLNSSGGNYPLLQCALSMIVQDCISGTNVAQH